MATPTQFIVRRNFTLKSKISMASDRTFSKLLHRTTLRYLLRGRTGCLYHNEELISKRSLYRLRREGNNFVPCEAPMSWCQDHYYIFEDCCACACPPMGVCVGKRGPMFHPLAIFTHQKQGYRLRRCHGRSRLQHHNQFLCHSNPLLARSLCRLLPPHHPCSHT